jgi:hypothetical protein
MPELEISAAEPAGSRGLPDNLDSVLGCLAGVILALALAAGVVIGYTLHAALWR